MSFKEYNQDQPFLFPPTMHEFIPDGHLAHVVNDIVNELDLNELYARYAAKGCSAYHPQMLLKVLFYGYAVGERSSRILAHRLMSDVAYMYLSGMQQPDFRTVNRFRKDNIALLKDLFVQIVRVCVEMGMVSVGRIAIDGTKIKANASYSNTKSMKDIEKDMEHIDRQIEELLKESELVDQQEDALMGDRSPYDIDEALRDKHVRKERIAKAKEKLLKNKNKEINLTDDESMTMLHRRYAGEPSYNGQVAVEEKKGVIVAATMTNNPADYDGLPELVGQTEVNTGEKPQEVLADSGFSSYENLEYLDDNNIQGYMPDQYMASVNKGRRKNTEFHKSKFTYHKDTDTYKCSQGHTLAFKSMIQRTRKPPLKIYQCKKCKNCGVKTMCTRTSYRTVSYDEREPLMQRMRDLLNTKEGQAIYRKRKHMVEPVFGDMKFNRNYQRLLLRTKLKAKGEFMLMCIAHNIRKIAKYKMKTTHTSALENISSYLCEIFLNFSPIGVYCC